MRINRLTVQGFGPYKTEQHVDFDAFADDGIFLMGGKTGAGKSSILDAICFALYDDVPRYDGTKSRLRSDHSGPDDASLVTLEFTAGDTRYRVERTPEYERLKARGTGTTKQKAEATLFELQGEDWLGIEAGPRNVGPRIAELVGLNKDQFLQVILLAQNRFQQFLLAKSEARQDVLRSLFGTRRFQDYEFTITEKRKALEADLESRRTTLTQMLEQAASTARAVGIGEALDNAATVDALIDELTAHPEAELLAVPESLVPERVAPWLHALNAAAVARVHAASEAKHVADTSFARADAAHDALLAQRAAQQRRAAAELRLEQLREASATIDADRASLAADSRAAIVAGAVALETRARATADTAYASLAAARAAWADQSAAMAESASDSTADSTSDFTVDSAGAEIAQLIERITLEQGALDEVVQLERGLAQQQARIEQLERAHSLAQAALAAAVARAAELPEMIAADNARLLELKVAAAHLASATTERDRLAASLAHAENATSLATALATARATELSTGQASTSASAELDLLRLARLNGHAAELAAQLRVDEPCAVCGSLAHPHPAQASDDAVDQDAIEAAELALALTREQAENARAEAADLSTRHAAAAASAGDLSAEALAALITAANDAVRAASAAQNESVALEAVLETRRTEQTNAEAAVASRRDELGAAGTALATVRVQRESDEKRVVAQRGTYESVAERSAALTRTLRLAHALAEALSAADVTQVALREADAALAGLLQQHGFADATAVSAAQLDASARASAELRVRTHDDAHAAATSTLAEPELAELPAEPVQLEASAAVLATAREARDDALAAHARVHGQASGLNELVTSAERQLAASAELIESYEIVARLAATLKGDPPNERRMRLESFVLAAELEEIVAAANARLRHMSGGRYTLEHDDAIGHRNTQSGLGLSILDSHTGQHRPTHSLSGGETFLASLALALGLAEVVTGRAGGITLDTLFIDEGFGSLDSDTLEIAMNTLDSLRTGGRTIGLISHVEAMKEQIHASLQVTVGEQGWSTISQAVA